MLVEGPGGKIATPIVVISIGVGEEVTGEGEERFVFGYALFEEFEVVVESAKPGLN